MIKGIDHIGLATDDPAVLAPFLTALGLRRDDAAVAEAYGVSCEFWSHSSGAGQPAVELVSPVRPDSAVAERLAKQGPGLYHLAFEVDELEPELARLRAAGFVQIDATPCAGARPGMRVAFMYLRKPAATLIELVEYGEPTEPANPA
ncbi:MAG TPA: VOC family protein [Jatrophihabitans sp.]|nr:VOC family protein [Jatrophihabitans sp.]